MRAKPTFIVMRQDSRAMGIEHIPTRAGAIAIAHARASKHPGITYAVYESICMMAAPAPAVVTVDTDRT